MAQRVCAMVTDMAQRVCAMVTELAWADCLSPLPGVYEFTPKAAGDDHFMSRILIVEDDPAILCGLRDNLEFESHQVLTATDGEAGYRSLCAIGSDVARRDSGDRSVAEVRQQVQVEPAPVTLDVDRAAVAARYHFEF